MHGRCLLLCYLFGIPYSMVYMRARALYPRMSPARSRLPASQFRGESGAASLISAKMACSRYSQRINTHHPCASQPVGAQVGNTSNISLGVRSFLAAVPGGLMTDFTRLQKLPGCFTG